MVYALSAIIAVLLGVCGYLLSRLYKIRLSDGPSSKGKDYELKKTWSKFDELLASLMVIHNLGAIGSGKTKQNEFFQIALDNACDLVGAIRGSVMVYDETNKELKIVASRGISREIIENTHIKKGEGIAGRAFEKGEIIFVTDPSQNPQYKGFMGYHEQTEPFISLPLKVQEKVYGVLNIHMPKGNNSFTDYDLKFLNILGGETAVTLENIKLYESVENFYLEMVQTLARIIDAKDSYTGDHAARARSRAVKLAKELNMPQQMVKYVEYAALLHDIGKIGIDARILLKPGKLTDEEYGEIKKHPMIGYQILAPIEFLAPVAQMVLYHQEWYNGAGYPDGLKGEEIPVGSRIVAIIDAWDAMTSDRPYRKAMSRERAREELIKGSGKQFDPKVVEVFLSLEEKEFSESAKN
ncbi:MAG: HD domain-containing phosphohydrolase [Elusimicrobiota bacterium]